MKAKTLCISLRSAIDYLTNTTRPFEHIRWARFRTEDGETAFVVFRPKIVNEHNLNVGTNKRPIYSSDSILEPHCIFDELDPQLPLDLRHDLIWSFPVVSEIEIGFVEVGVNTTDPLQREVSITAHDLCVYHRKRLELIAPGTKFVAPCPDWSNPFAGLMFLIELAHRFLDKRVVQPLLTAA